MQMLFLALVLFLQGVSQAETQAGSISGRILSPNGSPATNLRVAAEVASNNGGPEARLRLRVSQTDSAGRYRLDNVLPENYLIVVGWPVDLEIARPAPTAVTVGARMAVDIPDIRLTNARVSGRIITEGNRPIPAECLNARQVIVAIETTPSAPPLLTYVAADGSFDFPSVPSGRYQVRVSGRRVDLPVAETDIAGLQLVVPFPEPPVAPAISTNTPAQATLVVSQGGVGPRYVEGALPYFLVSSSGTRVEEKRLEGTMCSNLRYTLMPPRRDASTSFSLPAGNYDLRSYVRGCDGNCERLGAPQDECVGSITLKPGETLFAQRLMQGQACTLVFSSTPPLP